MNQQKGPHERIRDGFGLILLALAFQYFDIWVVAVILTIVGLSKIIKANRELPDETMEGA
ncbi:MAG: hypothetical protein AAF752_07265 [Bacteroidota bacterium]